MANYTLKVGWEDKDRLDIQSMISDGSLIAAVESWQEQGLLPHTFENKILLDFGCGVGSAKNTLLKLFPGVDYIGLDQASESIDCARQTFPETEFIVGDHTNTDVIAKANIIFIRFVIMHQLDPESFIRHIRSAMKQDALLLIYEPYTEIDSYTDLSKEHSLLADALTKRLQFKFKLAKKKGAHNLNYAPYILAQCGKNTYQQIIHIQDLPLGCVRELFVKNFESMKDELIKYNIGLSNEIDSYIEVVHSADNNIPVYLGTAYIILSM